MLMDSKQIVKCSIHYYLRLAIRYTARHVLNEEALKCYVNTDTTNDRIMTGNY